MPPASPALVALLSFSVLAAAPDARAQTPTTLNAALFGREEVPGPGDPDGFGAARVTLNPMTDQVCVNIGVLREHLIDMDEITLRARASERPLASGIEITVTGEGRTLSAIKRMVPAHARELAALGWSASTRDLPNGVKLVVTANDPHQVAKLKGLAFMGIMVQGAHHQPHHLMIAKGEFAH